MVGIVKIENRKERICEIEVEIEVENENENFDGRYRGWFLEGRRKMDMMTTENTENRE